MSNTRKSDKRLSKRCLRESFRLGGPRLSSRVDLGFKVPHLRHSVFLALI